METRPPKLIESIIGRLVPAACRENVLGDWNERYTSAPAYIIRALYTLPFLVSSRIRRTFKLERAVSEAVLLYIAYAVQFIARPASLSRQEVFLPVLIAVGTFLLALVLADAYADPEGDPVRQIGWNIGVAVAAVAGVEAILSAFHLSAWMLPWWFVLTGSAASLPLLFMVRRVFYSAGQGSGPLLEGSMTLEQLRRRAAGEHRQAWLLNLVWIIAGLAVIYTSPAGPNTNGRGAGAGLFLLVVLIGGFWKHRAGRSTASQESAALSISRDPHRNELERKRDGLQTWAGGGLFDWRGAGATLVFFLIGLSLLPFFLQWVGRTPLLINIDWTHVWLTIIAAIGLSAFWVFVRLRSLRAARAIQNELDAIDKEGRER